MDANLALAHLRSHQTIPLEARESIDKFANVCTMLIGVCHLEVRVMFKEFLFGTKADMVERGLILAAIVATAMAAWTTLGGNIKTKIEAISTQITSTP